MNEYTVRLGWNPAELTEAQIRADDFRTACVEARRGWGKAWSVVIVADLDTDRELDVAWHRSHADLEPEQWVDRELAAPTLVAIVSIDAFLAAFKAQMLGTPGNTAERPVWIQLNDMVYAPLHMGVDAYGAIVIVPNPEPSAIVGPPPLAQPAAPEGLQP